MDTGAYGFRELLREQGGQVALETNLCAAGELAQLRLALSEECCVPAGVLGIGGKVECRRLAALNGRRRYQAEHVVWFAYTQQVLECQGNGGAVGGPQRDDRRGVLALGPDPPFGEPDVLDLGGNGAEQALTRITELEREESRARLSGLLGRTT